MKKSHSGIVWLFRGQLAGSVGPYLKIGASAHVGGYLETRKWTDSGGQDHYTTEVFAEGLQGLGARLLAEG